MTPWNRMCVLANLLLAMRLMAASVGDVIVDDFESDTLQQWKGSSLRWVDGAGRDFGKALFELSVNRDSRYVKQGGRSLRFKSWAAEEGGYVMLAKRLSKQPPSRPTAPPNLDLDTLSLWVYRKEGTGTIAMRLFAPGGRHVAADIVINFDGWRRFTFGPGDWRGKGCEWQEIWHDLYLLYPVCHGKFDIYIDDLRFTSSKAQEKAIKAPASPGYRDREDTIYADFGGRGSKGLKFVSSSSESSSATIKDRRKCLLLDGPAQSWRYLHLDADDRFLPETGAPVAVTMEYYDHGTSRIYAHMQTGGKKVLYYSGPGMSVKGINNTQKGLWRKEVFYFPRAFLVNAEGNRDIMLMVKGKVYLASLAVRRFTAESQRAWEMFSRDQMDEMALAYSNAVVSQAYLMDEVRQVKRAIELLGTERDTSDLNQALKSVDTRVLALYKSYQDMYYRVRPSYCEGVLSERGKQEAVSAYLAKATELKSMIDEARRKAGAAIASLAAYAKSEFPWLSDFAFEFRSFPPIEPGDPIPMDAFGKRYLLGVPAASRTVLPLGPVFTNRSGGSGFLPSYCTGEGQYDFTRLDEELGRLAREYGLRGTLYPVYAGWCWKYLPKWFLEKHGDAVLPQSHDGHLGKGGGNRFHPALRKLWVDYASAMGKHLRGNDNLFMAMFLGEAYNHVLRKPGDVSASLEDGYSPIAKREFRNHLRRRYQSIEGLSQQWRTDYGSFDSIEPPKGVEHRQRLTPLIYEFEKFREDSWNELQDEVYRAYREADPTRHVTSMGGSRSELDPITIDVSGCHGGGFGLSHHYPYSMAHYYSIKRLSGKPLICREFNVVADEGRMGIATTRGELRAISERGFWQTSAWGQSGALLYTVGPCRDNVMENDVNCTVVRWFAGNVPLMRDKWDRLSKAYVETEIPHLRIGYIRTEPQRLIGWGEAGAALGVSIKGLHQTMFREHYNWFFVDDHSLFEGTDSLDEYWVIILGQPHVQGRLQDGLLAWAAKGGTLIVGGGAGAYDRFGRYSGRIMKEALGLVEVEYDPKKAAEIGVMRHANGQIDVRQQGKHFWYAKQKTVKPGAEVLSTYQDGSPAMLRARYGRGEVCASLYPFGWNDEVDAMFMSWLKQRIPLSQATCDEPLVEPVLREDKEGNRYLCITNVNWDKGCEPQFVLDGRYEKLVDLGVGNGIPVPSEIRHGLTVFTRRLDPGEGTILWLGKRTETAHPDAAAKAAWAQYLGVEKRVAARRQQGMDVEAEAQMLAKMKSATEDGAYDDAQSLARRIRDGLERKSAEAGADALSVLAKQLVRAIDASKHDVVTKARIHALRRMGEYSIGVDRKKAALYLNRAKGQINLAELPVRAGEIDIQCGAPGGVVKIDGNLGEWHVKKWERISSSRAWHGNPDSDEDISVQFAMMWDEARLYIAVKAQDDVVMNEVPVPRLPEQDGVEIHLNVLDDYGLPKEGDMGDGLPMPVYGPDDFQFVFGARGRLCRPDGPWRNTLGITWVKDGQAAAQERPGGYDLEIAIPWSGVFLEPVPGYTIGFTMSVNDCDHKGGKYEVQATYRGRQVCNNTEGWARVRLTE